MKRERTSSVLPSRRVAGLLAMPIALLLASCGLFFDGALASEATTEDRTLSGGTETTCFSTTVAGYPASHGVGPFCPETITDTAEAGGLWFDGNEASAAVFAVAIGLAWTVPRLASLQL